ncbi:MAG: hypothetical protein KDA38_12565 [Planctomycetales bacterium]|nr:hypothetical protein [Planctomycetales bacterium]
MPSILVWLTNAGSGLVAIVLTLLFSGFAMAEDVAIVRSPTGDATVRLTGEILEFRGDGLVMRRLGREDRIAADRVVEIQGDWSEPHRAADRLRASSDFAAASERYSAALRTESRGWVQRRLLADLAVCYANTGQVALAADAVLRLTADDAATPYLYAMPLNWQTTQPDAALAAQARNWLRDGGSESARLLGASWLLATQDRAAALAALNTLTASDDARVALLAEAQVWRTQLVQITAEQAASWREQLDRLPEDLRAGPTFVVGQAFARLEQSETAALLLMRVPILHADQADLAAACLTLAARQLENLGQSKDAARLYREVIAKHAGGRHAQEAEARLRTLSQNTDK